MGTAIAGEQRTGKPGLGGHKEHYATVDKLFSTYEIEKTSSLSIFLVWDFGPAPVACRWNGVIEGLCCQ